MSDIKTISANGLWDNNPALVQLLGLCPLLAVSGSVVNALGLGLATMFVLTSSNISVSIIRNQVPDAIRIPTFVMIIAAFTTCTQLLMQAFAYSLYQVMALFIALIVTNCVVLGRAESFAAKNTVPKAALDGFMMGLGFTLVLVLLGAIREVLGQGTLLADMDMLLGPIAAGWTITVLSNYQGFLIAILPPGAFLTLGFLIALKNNIDQWQAARAAKAKPDPVKGSKRVRVTGNIS